MKSRFVIRLVAMMVVFYSCHDSKAQKNATFSNDTTVVWLMKMDTLSFKIYHNKNKIPKEFYSLIYIEKISDIADSSEEFSAGCTGNGAHTRLNWIAIDKKNHWVLSVSHGGITYGTLYYFFDYDKGKMNVNILDFKCHNGISKFLMVKGGNADDADCL